MGEVAVGYSELGFDSINGLLKHGALDGGDVMVEAKGPTDNAGQVDDDAIIAGLHIIREFEMPQPQEAAVFVLEDFDANWIEG